MGTPRDRFESGSDLWLLALQAEMSLDDRGRIAGSSAITVLAAPAGRLLLIGDEIPDETAAEIETTFDETRHDPDPATPPPPLSACEAVVTGLLGPVTTYCGPYYVIGATQPAAASATIHGSDRPSSEPALRPCPESWHPDEWSELLDGRLGPWVVAVADDEVVSVCHTPRVMTAEAAECGVWTHPAYRGRGLAAAVVATWAQVLGPTGRRLFYSTTAANGSSQRVAARLGLAMIGWYWRLDRPEKPGQYHPHPLSRHGGRT